MSLIPAGLTEGERSEVVAAISTLVFHGVFEQLVEQERRGAADLLATVVDLPEKEQLQHIRDAATKYRIFLGLVIESRQIADMATDSEES